MNTKMSAYKLNIKIYVACCPQTGTGFNKEIQKQTNTKTHKQTNTQTNRHTNTNKHINKQTDARKVGR